MVWRYGGEGATHKIGPGSIQRLMLPLHKDGGNAFVVSLCQRIDIPKGKSAWLCKKCRLLHYFVILLCGHRTVVMNMKDKHHVYGIDTSLKLCHPVHKMKCVFIFATSTLSEVWGNKLYMLL